MEPQVKTLLDDADKAMHQSLLHYEDLLHKIRAGKVTPAILDPLRVDYYGNATPLRQVANISVSDARTLMVQPYEPKLVKVIEKAISEANIGANPQSQGNQIRVTFPPLTEERRKQLIKQVKEIAEEGRIAIRNIRRDHLEAIKKLSKSGVAEDVIKKAQDTLQKITDKYIQHIDTLVAAKEKEILTV
ncbi:MAG: ribosome recycling factor [Bacteroidia bacterium]